MHHITEEDLLADCIACRSEIISLGCVPSRSVNTFEGEEEKPRSPSAPENDFKARFGDDEITLPDRSYWTPVPRRFTQLSDELEFWDRQLDMWKRFLRRRERHYNIRKEDAEGNLSPLPSPSEMDRDVLLKECCRYISYVIQETEQEEWVIERWRGFLDEYTRLLEDTPGGESGEEKGEIKEGQCGPPDGKHGDFHHEHPDTTQGSPRQRLEDASDKKPLDEAAATPSRRTTPPVSTKRARSEGSEEDQRPSPAKRPMLANLPDDHEPQYVDELLEECLKAPIDVQNIVPYEDWSSSESDDESTVK